MKNFPHNILKEDDGSNAGTIYLYGIFGQRPSMYDSDRSDEDITDVDFMKAMKEFERKGKSVVNIRLNSPGGSMFYMDGMIAQVQSSKMDVHIWVDGVAASAAAAFFLTVPKERRHMAKNAKLMLHPPSGGAWGSAKELRSGADMLDAYQEGAALQLAADTGMSEEEVVSKFFDGPDHWYTARQCMELGFIAQLEDYEAENVPLAPENMSMMELENFFAKDPAKPETVNLFKKLFHAAFPQNHAVAVDPISQQKEEEMNLDNLKNSLGDTIQEADVVALLQERGYNVSKPIPAPAPEPVNVAQIVANAMKPLQDEIAAMQLKLDKTPTPGGPTAAVAAGDPPSGEEGDVTDTELLKKMAANDAVAAKNRSNPFSRV